jgi:hypothetical protein
MSRNAEISWQDPNNTGEGNLTGFSIQVMTGDDEILNITTYKINKYSINNLTPHTSYNIVVAAGNKHGFGEEVQTTLTTTEEGRNERQCNASDDKDSEYVI